jgi:hypothetical protein
MRLETSTINPLATFLGSIPESGLLLDRNNLEKIGKVFQTGGIIAETYKEVAELIVQFQEWYGMISIDQVDGKHILRKIDGKDTQ